MDNYKLNNADRDTWDQIVNDNWTQEEEDFLYYQSQAGVID